MGGYAPTQTRTMPLNGLRTGGPLMRLGQNSPNFNPPPPILKNGGGGDDNSGDGSCTCGCHPFWYLGTAVGGILLLTVLFR